MSTIPPPMPGELGPDDPAPTAIDVVMTAAEFTELERELASLRTKYRRELEQRLRDARAFGVGSENDDFLAAREEAAIDEARIARLEDLARSARIVDGGDVPLDGQAGLGSRVLVALDAGTTVEYELVGRRSPGSASHEVSLASPVGMALSGARSGDVVPVDLPNGRQRTLRVLRVDSAGSRPEGTASGSAQAA